MNACKWLGSFVFLGAVGCSSSVSQGEGPAKPAAPSTAQAAETKCATNTGYAGDDTCIEAPPPSLGFQLHYGPNDHDDPDEVAKYLLDPGKEIVSCYDTKTSNAEDVYSTGYQIHMRPGSHHLILQTETKPVPDGFTACGSAAVGPSTLGGSQVPIVDALTDPAPENQGLAIKIPARTQALFNFHIINTTGAPILAEAWANYLYTDEASVQGYRGSVFLAGGLGYRISPGEKKTFSYSCSPNAPSRILRLAAHMHEHASRMTAWKVSGDQRQKVLETFNWEEPGEVVFDSVHQNPPSNSAAGSTGGDVSGDLVIQPGEQLAWECEVANDTTSTLTFRNEVITGEMCVVTGSQVRDDDPMTPSDFACVRN